MQEDHDPKHHSKLCSVFKRQNTVVEWLAMVRRCKSEQKCAGIHQNEALKKASVHAKMAYIKK